MALAAAIAPPTSTGATTDPWLFVLLGAGAVAALFVFLLMRHRAAAVTGLHDLYLIHNSGRLLRHYATSLLPNRDPDLVGGMIAVVQAALGRYVGTRQNVQILQASAGTLVLVRGRLCTVAAFLDGQPSKQLMRSMQRSVTYLERVTTDRLRNWNGDLAEIPEADRALRTVLGSKA